MRFRDHDDINSKSTGIVIALHAGCRTHTPETRAQKQNNAESSSRLYGKLSEERRSSMKRLMRTSIFLASELLGLTGHKFGLRVYRTHAGAPEDVVQASSCPNTR